MQMRKRADSIVPTTYDIGEMGSELVRLGIHRNARNVAAVVDLRRVYSGLT